MKVHLNIWWLSDWSQTMRFSDGCAVTPNRTDSRNSSRFNRFVFLISPSRSWFNASEHSKANKALKLNWITQLIDKICNVCKSMPQLQALYRWEIILHEVIFCMEIFYFFHLASSSHLPSFLHWLTAGWFVSQRLTSTTKSLYNGTGIPRSFQGWNWKLWPLLTF